MNGIYHPAGCRCTGCLPGQYAMTPAATANRTAPRKPAAPSGAGAGIIFPVVIIGGVGFLTLCWPALAWHGYTGTGGWRWDIHSTLACLVYWGILIACIGLWGLAKTDRWARWSEAANTVPSPPQAPPVCTHRNTVPVNSAVTEELLARWCPDCETQLPAELSPPPPKPALPRPGAGWKWRFWCSCGTTRSGWSAAEGFAKDSASREVPAHSAPGHTWRNEWRSFNG